MLYTNYVTNKTEFIIPGYSYKRPG